MQSSTASPGVPLGELVAGCAGHPARVSFFVPDTTQLISRLHGAIRQVEPESSLILDLGDEVERLPADSPTVVEVIVRDALTILYANVVEVQDPYSVVLAWPHAVRTQQRRQFPRVDVEIPLHFLAQGSVSAKQGIIDNLSAGGLAFSTAQPIPQETELNIAFGLGSGFYLTSIRASVVRCTKLIRGGYQVAVRFVDLPPATFVQLRDWVRKRLAASESQNQAR